MMNHTLEISTRCTTDTTCTYRGQEIPIDIRIINRHGTAIGIPLAFLQGAGPIIKLVDSRTRADIHTPRNPANPALLRQFTMLQPGESALLQWILTPEDLEQFGPYVDLTAEITIMADIQVNGSTIEFRGSDTLRIVSEAKSAP